MASPRSLRMGEPDCPGLLSLVDSELPYGDKGWVLSLDGEWVKMPLRYFRGLYQYEAFCELVEQAPIVPIGSQIGPRAAGPRLRGDSGSGQPAVTARAARRGSPSLRQLFLRQRIPRYKHHSNRFIVVGFT